MGRITCLRSVAQASDSIKIIWATLLRESRACKIRSGKLGFRRSLALWDCWSSCCWIWKQSTSTNSTKRSKSNWGTCQINTSITWINSRITKSSRYWTAVLTWLRRLETRTTNLISLWTQQVKRKVLFVRIIIRVASVVVSTIRHQSKIRIRMESRATAADSETSRASSNTT